MPLYDFKCKNCKYNQEHYLSPDSKKKVICPKCKSEDYLRQVNSFVMNVEYSNVKEIIENKIDPSVKDVQAQIGKEFLDQDTGTLENIHGKDKIENTFYGTDD